MFLLPFETSVETTTKTKIDERKFKTKITKTQNTSNRSITTILWHHYFTIQSRQSQKRKHSHRKKKIKTQRIVRHGTVIVRDVSRACRTRSRVESRARPPVARRRHTMLPDRSASTIRARYNDRRPAPRDKDAPT